MATSTQVKALNIAMKTGPWPAPTILMEEALPAYPGNFAGLTNGDAVITINYANKVLAANGLPQVLYDADGDLLVTDPKELPGKCIDLWEDDKNKKGFELYTDVNYKHEFMGELQAETLEEDAPDAVDMTLEDLESITEDTTIENMSTEGFIKPSEGYVKFRVTHNEDGVTEVQKNPRVASGWFASGNQQVVSDRTEWKKENYIGGPLLSDHDREKLERLKQAYGWKESESREKRRNLRAAQLVSKIKKGRQS